MLTPDSATRRSLELRTSQYSKQLGEVEDAVQYLVARGITTATVDSFRLGFVADPLPGDEKYVGRVVVPYLTRSGVVQLRFRSLEEKPEAGQKYLGEPGVESRLFNTLALDSVEPTVYITEGEIDAISLAQAELPAIGLPGADSWKKLYRRCLRYRRVVVVADGDDAGWKAAKKIASDLDGCRIVSMPAGEDANSFLLEHGAEALRKRVGADD